MIGETLSHYQITAQLGAGGMGEVYLAEDTKLERKVALKVLPAELADNPDRLKRLQREARALAALDHPNIVTVFSVEEDKGIHFLTMAHVEGQGLDELIPKDGFSAERLLELAIPLADALRAAHGHGIVHRDLKPGNIMIDKEHRLRVLDFGLARVEAAAGPEDVTQLATQTMTQVGTVMGTYPYMSPEQAQGRVADARSDLFSFGVILYEMATGRRPFTGETSVSLISSILKDAPTPVTDVKTGLPEELGAIIECCLEKTPAERFSSAEELRDRLGALRLAVSSGQAVISARSRRRRFTLVAALVVVAVLAGVYGWVTITKEPEVALAEAAGPRIASLAVLPLRNFSGDPEQAYFVDGMTEALITDLSKIGALKVISRTSAMRYRDTEKPLAEIAEELGVEAVVEGSVLREGERVGITAQLIEVATDQTLWADRYERDLTSVLALQGEIARAIAGEIRVALSPEEEARLSTPGEVDPDAYDAVLKGLVQVQQFTPQSFNSAMEYFETALEIAPDYAPAYVGMARVWSYRNQFNLVRPSEAAPLRRELLGRALELDDSLADVHLALANFRTWHEWNWSGGEEEFLRAIELNPSYAEARIFYSHLLTIVGRAAEGTAQAERALELDPLNPFFRALAGVQLSMAGRTEEGVALIRRTLDENPGLGFGHDVLWDIFHREGLLEEAFAEARASFDAVGDRETVEALDYGWKEGEYGAAMREAASVLERRSLSEFVGPTLLAIVNDYAGYTDGVFPWLEEAYQARDPFLPYLRTVSFSRDVRSDPRFRDLLRRMNLPDNEPEWLVRE